MSPRASDAIESDCHRSPSNHTSLPFVSVVVPVFNDPEGVRRCVAALERQTYPARAFEVIVVDNGSETPVETVLEPSPRVRCVREPRPGSYAARNRGIAGARGHVIAMTDADCIPAPDWIERGVERLQTESSCGVVGGQIQLCPQDAEHPTITELYEMIMEMQQQRFIEGLHFCATANAFTTKRVIDEVGVFEASLKSGGDTEWSGRVSRAGYRLVYAGEVVVSHPARRTWAQLRQKTIRIAGGLHELAVMDKSRSWAVTWDLLRDLVPPVRSLERVLTDPRPASRAQQARVALLVVLVRYSRALERVRLCLGGRAHRA